MANSQPDIDEQLRGELREQQPTARPLNLEKLGAGIGYRAVIGDARVRLSVDQIRQGRDGLRGDVRVELGPFGRNEFRVLTEGRLELSSLSHRETWERRLVKRWKNADWGSILDRFTAQVIAAEARTTTPGFLLREAPRPVADGFLMEPLLLANFPTLWYGAGGSMKSLLAMCAALSVHTGEGTFAGMRPTHPLRVLFCDFEFDAWAHRERMRRLCHFEEVIAGELPDITYLDCKGTTLVGQVERIQSVAKHFGSEFLMVDSISYAAEGALKDDETARTYYRALGQIGLPSLSTAHVPKDRDDGATDTPFGSVHWLNLCRLAWHFGVVQLAQSNAVGVLLTNTRCSIAAKQRSIGLKVSFGDFIEVEKDSLQAGSDNDWKKIVELLKHTGKPMSYLEIGLGTGMSEKAARARVSENKDMVWIMPLPGTRKSQVQLKDE